MKAVLMAGGRGVRLAPYHTHLPTPLVPIGGEIAMVEVLLTQLARQGFDEVYLSLGHMGHLVRSFVGDGSKWGVSVRCWDADDVDVSALRAHLDELPEHFLLLDAAVLTDLDMGDLVRKHIANDAALTLATYERKVSIAEGSVLDIDGGHVLGFASDRTVTVHVPMGVQAVSRESLADLPDGPLGVEELVNGVLASGSRPAVMAFDGYWLNIRNAADYSRANEEFAARRSSLLDGPTDDMTDAVIDLTAARESAIDLRDAVGADLDRQHVCAS